MGDTQPTQPLPPYTHAEKEPRRRRGCGRGSSLCIVVVGLAVAAWFAGEWIARDVVTKTIRQQVITQLSLPADQQVDVEVEGIVLPQLIGGIPRRRDDRVRRRRAGRVRGRRDRARAGHRRSAGMPAPAPHCDRACSTRSSCARCCRPWTDFPAESLGLAEPDLTDVDRAQPLRRSPCRSASRSPRAPSDGDDRAHAGIASARRQRISAAAPQAAVRRLGRHRPARLDDLHRPVHPGGRRPHRHRRDRRPRGRRPRHRRPRSSSDPALQEIGVCE